MAKILIVDDDVRAAEYIGSCLRTAGHACAVVRDGQQAIAMARADAVDLLVLDVMMPGGVSGFEICRRIRADSELYMLPIVMLSAMTGEEEVKHGLAQGADDYVTKPFEVQNLVQRIEGLLRINTDALAPDDMTALPQARATKREVQRRVTNQETITLACAELLRLPEFAQRCGAEARGKAIRHLARALKLCGRQLPSGDFMVGHMGGGYFVCILHPIEAEAYCDYVMKTWRGHLASFYESVNLLKPYQDALAGVESPNPVPVLDLLICSTSRRPQEIESAQKLFEVLMRIRNGAFATKVGGVHFDRRA